MRTGPDKVYSGSQALPPTNLGPVKEPGSAGLAGTLGFGATHWSLVLKACQTRDAQAGAALEQLCQQYWNPIYHYVRRRGHPIEDAKDLTQAFFEQFLKKQSFHHADRNRGQFRCFLLSCLKHFLSDAHDRASAKKRGGNAVHMPLEWAQAEKQLQTQLLEENASDKIYDRSWALATLEAAREAIRGHYHSTGKGKKFDILAAYLTGDESRRPYEEAASELGMRESAVKTEVGRMRLRFRAHLRSEIAMTVSRPEEIDEEIRYLVRIV